MRRGESIENIVWTVLMLVALVAVIAVAGVLWGLFGVVVVLLAETAGFIFGGWILLSLMTR